MNLSLSQKGLIVVVVILVLEMTFVAALLGLLHEADRELQREQHAQAVIFHLNRQANLMQNLTIESIRYVITKNPVVSQHQKDLIAGSASELATLKSLLADDPSKLEAVQKLQARLDQGLSLIDKCREAYFAGNQMLHWQLAANLHTVSDQCTEMSDRLLDQFLQVEKTTRLEHAALAERVKNLLLLGLIANVLLCAALALLFARGITRRLAIIEDNTLRLAANQPLNEALQGHDELVRMDQTFRRMARELTLARQKEQAVIDNARDVICTIGKDEKFQAVSPAALPNWGYTPEELLASRYINLVVEEDREETHKTLTAIARGEKAATLENRLIKKDGSVAQVDWSIQWSESEQSFFCVAHDITERKEIEKKKQEFVAMVSHDLRTPLTSIGTALELIASGRMDAQSAHGQGRIEGAQESIRRLVDLVNDLLDVEKLSSGTLNIDPECIDLSYVIHRSIESVRGPAEKGQVTIKPPQPATTLQIIGERDRCIQVLTNLLSNAVKFSPPGSTVEISATACGAFAELRVKDRGKGIAPEYHQSIFERFQQVSSADGKRGVGTGLGLAICKAIVEAHKGTIGVESAVGEGSTFWFQIPLADPDPL
ncbi:MAG: PAS domain S-box protein [Cyanobacteria bacterium SZAS LIN-2]|nr:PAS domain S-box protein [Cyanobacteria bacterium SZAS LIN-2]